MGTWFRPVSLSQCCDLPRSAGMSTCNLVLRQWSCHVHGHKLWSKLAKVIIASPHSAVRQPELFFPRPRPRSGPWPGPVFIFYWTLLPTLQAYGSMPGMHTNIQFLHPLQ